MASQALAHRQETSIDAAVPNTLDAALSQFRSQLSSRADDFKLALPAHITPERFQRTILTAVQADPELLKADRRSLILACMKAAQDGTLPDKREAALVIFKENKKVDGNWVTRLMVQYMCMVFGLRKKILQSGEIRDITSKVVYRREAEEGYFIYEEGTEAMLRHKPMLDLREEDTGDDQIVAAYSMATYMDGTKSYEVMRRFEIDKVRECSQTGATRDRKGNPRNPSGPWVDWYPEQAKKTVMRRHSKTLPMSGDLIDVEGYEDDVAARSSQAVLAAVQEEAPVVLPGRSETDGGDGSQRMEDNVDPETGEVLDEDAERDAAEQLDRQTFAEQEGRAGDTDQQQGQDDDTEAGDGGDDWIAWLDGFKSDLKGRATVPDVNSYWSDVQAVLGEAPQPVQVEAAKAKDARIGAIKGGK